MNNNLMNNKNPEIQLLIDAQSPGKQYMFG